MSVQGYIQLLFLVVADCHVLIISQKLAFVGIWIPQQRTKAVGSPDQRIGRCCFVTRLSHLQKRDPDPQTLKTFNESC